LKQLIEDIKTKLNIKGGDFINAEIESYIEEIDPSQHLEFFKALSGDEYDYKNAMDRIAITAKRFKASKSDSLFSGTRDMAKDCYSKLYTVNASMTTYTQENRDRVPNDRDFFCNMDYSAMIDKHGVKVFTKQDLYILDELGGGEWLMNIKFITNSNEAVDKIERIIKSAITAKYMKPKHEVINHEVRKMLR
jgi:hypothetical protein